MGQIKDSEHVFISGSTGSGKTYLAQVYAAGVEKRVIVLDTKGTFEWPHVPKDSRVMVTTLVEVQSSCSMGAMRIIYRPIWEELNFDYYNAFFQFCYQLGNTMILVDEVMQVCPTPSKIPEFYKGILTRGRELNTTVWSCTQRPATIPVVVYSESTHWFIFQHNAQQDRERLAEFTGYDVFDTQLPKQQFLYYDVNTNTAPVRGKLVVKGVS